MARHALAAEHVRRTLVLASRAGYAMRNRVAVGRVLSAEVVALDDAGEALAEGHALHVDSLPDLEDGADVELGPRLQVRQLLGLGAEFAQRMARLDARLGEMTGQRLVDARRAALAEPHLHGGIAVGLGGLDLGNAAVRHVDHRHGQRRAVLGKDACHADLAADQSDAHTFLFYLGRRLRGDAGCNWPALHLVLPRRYAPLLALLNLDLHVHARRQIELHERVHRLVCRVDDVHEPQVRADFELVAGGLDDVRRARRVPALLRRRQRHRAAHDRAGALRRIHDLERRLVDQPVVERLETDADALALHFFPGSYSMIFATTPAPTVLPPSRMAKRRPCSIAIGVISVTTIFTLSPGITISVPFGNSTAPVTSVVRK